MNGPTHGEAGGRNDSTVSFHNFKSRNFKLSVSNPENKYVAYVSVLSRISNRQSLGRKNKHENLKTDRCLFVCLSVRLRSQWSRSYVEIVILANMQLGSRLSAQDLRPTPPPGLAPPPTAIGPAPRGGSTWAKIYIYIEYTTKGSALANDQGPPSLTTGSGPE